MAKKETLVFIDTCSLLVSCWTCTNRRTDSFSYSKEKEETFWNREFKQLSNSGRVIIPKRNYEELVKHAKNAKRLDLASRSGHTLKIVDHLREENLIEIVGDPNDPFADAILLSVALKFRTQRNMTFVTQDRDLAADLESIRHFQSVQPRDGYDIEVLRISESGKLETHRHKRQQTPIERPKNTCPSKPEEPKKKAWWSFL